MHQALYRKWRPQSFDDVYGQEHITSVLRYEVENRSFSHAYLFCGSRGTGKTTCAKILAKVVNCESPVNGNPCGVCEACRAIDSGAATDVLEMDAASNNGVDNIRDIRDEVVYSPSALRYRVYIIDEVHMLSSGAFNALLKTLEEPPAHVIFILATTELHKLPATIVSRCQRFDFRRISTDMLVARISQIAREEGIALQADAASMIARLAQGGMRDAISLLELCAGGRREVTVEAVEDAVGLTGRGALLTTVKALTEQDYDTLFEQIAQIVRSSKDISVFWQDLIDLYRDMLVVKTTTNADAYLDLTDHEKEQIKEIAGHFRKETLLYHCKLLENAMASMKKNNAVNRVVAEMTLIRMCDEALDTSSEALLSRMAILEERLDAGHFVEKTTTQTPSEPKPTVEQPTKPAPTRPPTAQQPRTAPQSVRTPAADTRVLRPMRNWMEVVERVSRSAPMLAGHVKLAKGYTTDSGEVIVCFGNSFTMQMMMQGDARDRLRTAISAVLKREVGDRQLIMETKEECERHSVIDEIMDASQE